MRSPPFLFVYIGVIAAIVTASAVYSFTQNSNEQPLRPGDYHVTLTYQGLARSYVLHVPPQYDGNTSLPLVIALHYLGVDAETFANVSHLNEKADAEGFFVVYPQGLNNSWNAGSCCGSSSQQKVDDAGFIKAILVQLKSQLPVNDSRVYAIGVSNGGMLAYSLACDFPEDFAAIASIAEHLSLRVVTRPDRCRFLRSMAPLMRSYRTTILPVMRASFLSPLLSTPSPTGHSTTGPFPSNDNK